MPPRIQELDFRPTPMGELSLRRRRDLPTGQDVYEILLGDEYLMSSMFTVAEEELARLALARLPQEPGALDVAVGGLGLGFTALAALAHPAVRSLVVIDALAEVIEWHRQGLIPAGTVLGGDPRCRLVHGDFFALLGSGDAGLDPAEPGRRWHAVLVDIDHSPRHVLHPDHAAFYQPDGLRQLAGQMHPGGVFGLWSNDPPDQDFVDRLGTVFGDVAAEVVRFPNPLQDREATNTVYLATTP